MIPEFSWYDYGLFVLAIAVTALAFGWAGLTIGYRMKLREASRLQWPASPDWREHARKVADSLGLDVEAVLSEGHCPGRGMSPKPLPPAPDRIVNSGEKPPPDMSQAPPQPPPPNRR